jgi:subtilisin family serine protease
MFPAAPAALRPNDVDLSSMYTVSYTSPNDPFTLAEELSKLPEVQYAEPWFIYPLARRTFTPNDSLYELQWSLDKIGAPAAWEITKGDSTIVIAIVDSGVEWTHPDLAANIWTNPGESGLDAQGRDKRTNGIDDDENGYVDDWHGWDLVGGLRNVVLPMVFILTLMGATAWALWRRRPAGYLGAWFFVILAPTSSVIPIDDVIFEHRMYLPLAGLVVMAVIAGYSGFDQRCASVEMRRGRGRRMAAVAVLFIVILAALTASRNPSFR